MKEFLEKKLKLKVNPKKSKVERASWVKFLGYSFYKPNGETLLRMANRTKERFFEKIRHLSKRTRPGKLEDIVKNVNKFVIGWIGYYRLATTPSMYKELDAWIRRRLRQMVWKSWKRGTTRYHERKKLGVPKERAALGAVGKSPWYMSRTPVVNEVLSNAFWRRTGLEIMKKRYFVLPYSC